MPRFLVALALIVGSIMTAIYAAQPQTGGAVRLLPVAGTFVPADGGRPNAAEAVTLAIYADETGGSPLWQETQRVAVDGAGRYSLLLGSTAPDGLPIDLFASGDARWLAVTFDRSGEKEGPRTRLTSVPYALHATSADTLGGLPASAYMLAPSARGEGAGDQQVAALGVSATLDPQAVLPGTTNFLAKYVNGVDVGNSAVFEADGKVGVGTTSPLDAMSVRFNNTTGQFTGYAVQNLGSTATSYSGMLFFDQNGALGQFQGFNNSTHEYRVNNIARRASDSEFDGTINFMIGSASRLFVASTGFVGIGTTSPTTHLDVVGSISAANGSVSATTYNGLGTDIAGLAARGTRAAPSGVLNNDLLAFFSGNGYYSGSPGGFSTSSRSGMQVRAGENWTSTAQGSNLDFYTVQVGTTTPTLQMRIDAGGFVGIGTASPNDRLQVIGNLRIGTAGTNGCVKNFNGDALVGSCASDRRFKTDVTPFGPVLSSLSSLQPVHYNWRAAEFPTRHFGNHRSYGLLAQDVEKVLPELVATDADGYKTVDYSKLPLLTIQAVKELKAENDAVRQRNQALDSRNAALEARVAELERQMKDLLAMSRR